MEQDPLIGQQLGAYQIQAKLGEGGMARVYKAYHARLRRDVAIKVILSRVANRPEFKARFEREAQLIANLEHNNIVSVYDFGETDQTAYLVMQYVGGGTLREQLRGNIPLDSHRAAHYTIQIARALHHAHQRGIVHRDIKPQNMLVSSHDVNHLLLSDFGIAKLFDQQQDLTLLQAEAFTNSMSTLHMPEEQALTNADQIVGTIEYMAPEQINRGPVDARTDVYALGVVLFQMLTGRVPFQSANSMAVMYQHVHITPPSVYDLNPQASETLVQITAKALAKDPAARFQSAEAMAEAIEMSMTFPLQRPSTSLTNLGGMPRPLPHQQSLGGYSQFSTPGSSYAHPSSYSSSATPTSMPPAQTPTHLVSRIPQVTAQTSLPGVTAGNTSLPAALPQDTQKRKKSVFARFQTIATIFVVILAIALITSRVLPQLNPPLTTQTTGPAQSFVENFKDNTRQWPDNAGIGPLALKVQNQTYQVINDDTQHTGFPYPKAVGTLPETFTLTAQISQIRGDHSFYGITFHTSIDANDALKSCYAFAINNTGQYAILRYDNGQQNATWSMNWNNRDSTLIKTDQANELQIIAKGGGVYSFAINGQSVRFPAGSQLTDTTYTKGYLGLIVSPGIGISVKQIQFTTP